MAVSRFVFDQPGQQIQAALPERRVVECDARGDHRLDKHPVRVGESRLGPRPRAIASGCGDRSRIVGDELACRGVHGIDAEELGGSQCCEGHRPRRLRPCMCGALELDDRQPADHARITVGSGGTEPPDAPAPVVVRGRLVSPTAVAVHSVAAGTAVCLRLVQEAHRNPGETVHLAFGVGFSGGDDKNPGHVVGAVAVLGPARRNRRARRCRDGLSVAADGRTWEEV